jgi:SAM-dependent methyltransferase
MSYKKYQGDFEKSLTTLPLKIFHNNIKGYFIKKFSSDKNVIIDVGSGRGTDARHYMLNNVKLVIGIEPSKDSIEIALKNEKKLRDKYKKNTKFIYLNGFGEKQWSDGSASIDPNDTTLFIELFKKQNIKADNINLFWTIHYMMDTYNDFHTLLNNIKNQLKNNGTVVVLCMDGKKIHELLQKNQGYYSVKQETSSHDKPQQITETSSHEKPQQVTETSSHEIFGLKALYPYKENIGIFGNKIEVYLKATYGLEKGIIENLVFIDDLIKFFADNGFKLIMRKNHMDLSFLKSFQDLTNAHKKVAELYEALVFKSNN